MPTTATRGEFAGAAGTGGLVFGVAGLLALIALLPRLASRLRLPARCSLAALGCALGLGIGFSDMLAASMPGSVVRDFFQQLRQLDITAEVLLWVFCDPAVRHRHQARRPGLLDDLGPILILAVVAVLMTTAAARFLRLGRLVLQLTACLLVAAIIATTDPSAVTAVFREVGAQRRLTLLVEARACSMTPPPSPCRPRYSPSSSATAARTRRRRLGTSPSNSASISSAAPWSAPSWSGSRRSWSAASTKAARPR